MARVVFFGTPDFSLPALRALLAQHTVLAVVTQPDRPAGRGRQRVQASSVKELAVAHGVEVLQPQRLRHARRTQERLRELDADVFVLAAYGQILPAAVLAIPPHGCIGIHASLLPLLRGAAPIATAILEGYERTGVTLMLTDPGMDTGPIIAQAPLDIAPNDTTATLTAHLAELGAALLIEKLPAWLNGAITPTPQDDSQATFAPPISREDALIHWELPAMAIERRVRAYDPWPGAYTTLHGQTLKVLAVSVAPDTAPDMPAGTVIRLPAGLGVVTGDGVLMLERVQLAGKKPMAATDLARGHRDLVGARLGE